MTPNKPRVKEVLPPTKRELEEELRLVMGQLWQGQMERDSWEFKVKAQEERIAKAHAEIERVLKLRDQAPEKIERLEKRAEGLRNRIKTFASTDKPKLGRRSLERLALTRLGGDAAEQTVGREIIAMLNDGVEVEEIVRTLGLEV